MIYVIIPVFNRRSLTQSCLKSLSNQTLSNTEFKIIVVDHGSTDGTSNMILSEFAEAMLIKGDNSMWWTGATNLGVKKALELSKTNSDFILTLNNDLEVDNSYLEELLKTSHKHKPCLVGSLSVDITNTDRISFAGGSWNQYTAKYTAHKNFFSSYKQLVACCEFLASDLLPGRGVLIPINAFHDLGLYDQITFPHYSADDDFSLRCKRNGYKLIVSCRAVVKSHLNENGRSPFQNNKSFDRQKKALISIKSPVKLSTRYAWAKKNTPIPILYFAFDVSRIIVSALLKSLKNR